MPGMAGMPGDTRGARDIVDARDARDARRRLCGRAISGQEDIARHRSDRVSDRYLTLIRR